MVAMLLQRRCGGFAVGIISGVVRPQGGELHLGARLDQVWRLHLHPQTLASICAGETTGLHEADGEASLTMKLACHRRPSTHVLLTAPSWFCSLQRLWALPDGQFRRADRK